jgi:chromosomal replication initiator protein
MSFMGADFAARCMWHHNTIYNTHIFKQIMKETLIPLVADDTNSVASEATNDTNGPNREKFQEAISHELKKLVSNDAYGRWFEDAIISDVNETEASLVVPSDIHQVWIEANYMPEVQTALSSVSNMPLKMRIIVDEALMKKSGLAVGNAASDEDSQTMANGNDDKQSQNVPAQDDFGLHVDDFYTTSDDGSDTTRKKLKKAGLNPLFNFDRFVVGQNNEFAHAACIAVANAEQAIYNPLFIHGGSGLGKTHMMQAIGQKLMLNKPGVRVVYLTCEKFINEFIDTVRKGSLERFRKKYRRADILLIDDVQFLGGKERSQEEFFHTFNELLDLQSQIVLTSDRPASEITNIEPRLISRFECGLTVELQPPGIETRMAIIRRKMDEWDVALHSDILEMIAERIQSNVRRLEGALVRIATFASLGTEQVTVERAEYLLKDILQQEGKKRVNIDAIQKTVTEYYDLRIADMTSRRRPSNIAFPRQVAMYLSRRLTQCSLMEIGEAFGGRDHGTVIYAVRKVQQRMECEPQVRESIEMITTTLHRK